MKRNFAGNKLQAHVACPISSNSTQGLCRASRHKSAFEESKGLPAPISQVIESLTDIIIYLGDGTRRKHEFGSNFIYLRVYSSAIP